MKFASLALAALALTTSSIFIACASGDTALVQDGAGASGAGASGPTSGPTTSGSSSSSSGAGGNGAGGNGAGGSNGSCIAVCNIDQDCANTCAPVASGSNCCSSNKCYVSSQPVCPSSSSGSSSSGQMY